MHATLPEPISVQGDESHFYIMQLSIKLASGEYQMEAVPCFCGGGDQHGVVQADRYGIEYRLGVCLTCGLLYANPRLTADSYRKFYQHEYRKIYATHEDEAKVLTENGMSMQDFLDHSAITTDVVVDVGCNDGTLLKVFLAKGATCYGVDYDETAVAKGQAEGLPLQVGDMSTLIAQGVKADFVIMQHVFEHFLDLEVALDQVRQLLTPTGKVWMSMPGLQTRQFRVLFQNAHTYQFTADSLQYVMECCGFNPLILTEEINSLWEYTGIMRDKHDVPRNGVADVLDAIGRDPSRLPEIKTFCKFNLKDRRDNMAACLASPVPDICALKGVETGHAAIIIAGGPSVDGQVKQIRQLVEHGAKIVAIERMYSWCLKRNLVPDYVVVLDSSDDVMESLDVRTSGTRHLVATTVNPAVLTTLKDVPTYIFNATQGGIDYQACWDTAKRDEATILNAGGSVALCSMVCATYLGMRDMHIFGFDCHVTKSVYATDITGVGPQPNVIKVNIPKGGPEYLTTLGYLSFAQQFFILVEMGHGLLLPDGTPLLGVVKVYGDSLVTAMNTDIQG